MKGAKPEGNAVAIDTKELAQRRPIRAADCAGTDLGDELLFYDHDGGPVRVLNAAAREIYLLCDGTRSVEELAQAFAAVYGLDPVSANLDTERTLHELIDLGLVNLS